jgi:hypothetical protein
MFNNNSQQRRQQSDGGKISHEYDEMDETGLDGDTTADPFDFSPLILSLIKNLPHHFQPVHDTSATVAC